MFPGRICDQCLCLKDWPHGKVIPTGELLPMRWSHIGEVNKGSHGRDPRLRQQQEHQCDELTIMRTPIPISLGCWVGGGRTGKEGGVYKRCFRRYFISPYPALILIGNEFTEFSQFESLWYFLSGFPLPLSCEPLLSCLSLLQLYKAVRDQLWWVPAVHCSPEFTCSYNNVISAQQALKISDMLVECAFLMLRNEDFSKRLLVTAQAFLLWKIRYKNTTDYWQ